MLRGPPADICFRETKGGSPCRKRSPAKGVWQKSDEKSDRSIRKSDRIVTKSIPKATKSDRTQFAALLLRHLEGWKTQGRGKHTMKPLPKNGFGPPPTYDTFPPPPLVFALLFSLEETGTEPSKLVLEAALYGTFSPPKSHDTFCPPH